MVRTAQALAFYLACSTRRSFVFGFTRGSRISGRTTITGFNTSNNNNNYNNNNNINNNHDNNNTTMSSSLDISANLQDVRQRLQLAAADHTTVRLVAVSKTKPNELLMECYHHGQRIFGENYVQELVEKASSMPHDITWHFIGPLQSNKAKLLVTSVVPHAAGLVVETVATLKLAKKLQSAMEECTTSTTIPTTQTTLKVFVQVNTSGEESKSGIEPDQIVELCRSILDECPSLTLMGLMTIGAPGDLNCFKVLAKCRDETLKALDLESLELSMGMSDDFPEAIAHGATNIRVGSTIFGARDYTTK
jgi:PLP dependent protein